jgi:hypothetical protein
MGTVRCEKLTAVISHRHSGHGSLHVCLRVGALMIMGLRTKIYAISLLGGAIISCVIVWLGLYLPLNYPGLFFAIAVVALGHGDHWKSWVLPTLVISANTVFYGWIASRLLRAEVATRGALGRRFLK